MLRRFDSSAVAKFKEIKEASDMLGEEALVGIGESQAVSINRCHVLLVHGEI